MAMAMLTKDPITGLTTMMKMITTSSKKGPEETIKIIELEPMETGRFLAQGIRKATIFRLAMLETIMELGHKMEIKSKTTTAEGRKMTQMTRKIEKSVMKARTTTLWRRPRIE